MKKKYQLKQDDDKRQNYLVHFLTIIFAMGPFIGLKATMLQAPILMLTAPEGLNLPSYTTLIMQGANVLPIVYALYQRFSVRQRIKASYLIYGILVIEMIASVVAMFTLSKTVFINGNEYSVPFYVITFMLAICGFGSPVLCMPYMGNLFSESYLLTYILGEALGGFVPSMIGFAQGASGDTECIETVNSTADIPEFVPYTPPPRFSSEYFYIFVFFMVLLSMIAFYLLDNLNVCRKEHVVRSHYDAKSHLNEKFQPENRSIAMEICVGVLTLAFVLSFSQGILGSMMSYALTPYGNDVLYYLTNVTLAMSPLAWIVSLFFSNRSKRAITILSLLCLIMWSYIIAAASMSPNPPLVGTIGGKVFIILCGIISVAFDSYVRICLATLMRSKGGKFLVYYGGVSQTGVFIGTVISFLLVNYSDLFVSSINRCL